MYSGCIVGLEILTGGFNGLRDDLVPTLRDALLTRASDKIAAVRVQSVFALKRLQAPDDAKDAVTAELLRLMASDPSKYVFRT